MMSKESMLKMICIFLVFNCVLIRAREIEVKEIHAFHRNGQTFVAWKDVAEGEEGAVYRYSVYRSDVPITQANLSKAECVILHASCGSSGKLRRDLSNYFLYFAPEKEMDWRAGQPGAFSIREGGREHTRLTVMPRDTMTTPGGRIGRENLWFGLFCSKGKGP